MSRDRARQRFVELTAVAVWIAYASSYAITFALTGLPIWTAVRAALANSIPDALLAIAAIRISLAIDRAHSAAPGLVARHAPGAIPLVALAAASKGLLIWIDYVIVARTPYQFSPALVFWHTFLSALVYVTVAAATHAWLIGKRLREEEANAVRAEALRARAEIAALRAQLNPHFLFNTLHSVLGLVRRDPALAEAALEKLGDLLHYATRVHRNGVDWIALRHECDFVDTYLDLEAIRLGDRLRVVRNLDESALECQVPTFSLQPLVENAVRHGIAPRAEGGQIVIGARLQPDGNRLRLEVCNDGAGRASTDSDEGGLGLRVLRERLDALYRGTASMTAGSTPGGGYSVVLTLPVVARDTEVNE
ncbi:MAG: sensor histidine kinase [Acidobacteriota bacterium]